MANPPQQSQSDFGALDVERFEHVPGGRELALLRLEGRYRSRLARPLLDAALLVDDGLAIHRHEALPQSATLEADTDGDDWLWRAAFAVSLAALEDPETAFVLEAGPGITIELGGPAQWQPPSNRQLRRGAPLAVGRRAAAAAMLVAIAVTSGPAALAEAAALNVHRADGSLDVIHAQIRPAAPLCPPEALRPGADPKVACIDPSGHVHGTQTQSGAAGTTAPADTSQPAGTQTPGGGPTDHHPGAGQSSTDGTPKPSGHGHGQHPHPSHHRAHHRKPKRRLHRKHPRHVTGHVARPSRIRHSDGSPTKANPGFFDALPGSSPQGVSNFVIEKFRVPIFLLPIYQAAGIQYGIQWQILAAINEIETDYGRNLNVSSAGALGWMQFMPATWATWGVDGNHDGKRDPYNPVDAIFSAARYLQASGGSHDVRRGIFAYNHAGWYVDSVLLRAKLLGAVPSDVVGSLTGLTEGRFPVAAHARYADDPAERAARQKAHGHAVHGVPRDPIHNQVAIYANDRSPVVAVNDGQIQSVSHSRKLGRYVVLEDTYGNRYTYSGLGSVAQLYPVPKKSPAPNGNEARAVTAHRGPLSPHPSVVTKRRVFAHPARVHPKASGGLEQMFDEASSGNGFSTYSNLFTPGLGLNSHNSTLRRLRKGSRVIAGTVLGRVGRPDPKQAAHMNFGIRPAGRGAPPIDPKPILDGWKLLESTAIYRANGKNVLKDSNVSIGQILMMPKAQLQKRVLSDNRIKIYPAGRNDIRTGQINRRVLAVLEFLAESGMNPTVSCLKSGHSEFTSSGNVSEHSSGNAVDISAINGISILGHQDKGGIAYQAVRRLMTLQGTIRPHQIISLQALGGNTMSMPDHANHIHVGFHPVAGDSKKVGIETLSVLKPSQWTDLIGRLRQIQNPVVPTSPSQYALPVLHRRSHTPPRRGHGR